MVPTESELALKELQELEQQELKKKAELEKLKKKIRQAAKNAKEQQEFEERVPLEQVAALSSEGMSAEEKTILAAHQGKSGEEGSETDEVNDEDSSQKKDSKAREVALEDKVQGVHLDPRSVSRFAPSFPDEALAQQQYQTVLELSQQPVEQLYSQMKTIYDTSVTEGYVSGPQVAQTFELESAIERKLHDIDEGTYQFTSDTALRAVTATLAMKNKVQELYVAKRDLAGEDLYVQ